MRRRGVTYILFSTLAVALGASHVAGDSSCPDELPKEHLAFVQRQASLLSNKVPEEASMLESTAKVSDDNDVAPSFTSQWSRRRRNRRRRDRRRRFRRRRFRRRRDRRRRDRRRRDRRRRTPAPTQPPTANPTANPTAAPTSSPTDSPTSSPTNSPTSSPTETVYGTWTVTRTHAEWNHLTKNDEVCGKHTDVLSIGSVFSNWCKTNHQSTGQAIVNQDGDELSFAWFCSNQGATTIVGTPTFEPEEGDGPCAHQHQVGDQGK